MKINAFATAAMCSFFFPAISHAGSYEQHFGGQEGVNRHLQGSVNDIQDVNTHQYKYLDGLKADDKVIRESVKAVDAKADNNAAWNDRQEGVIRQSRGRLDGHDTQISDLYGQVGGNTDRSIGNQHAIGDIQSHQGEQDGRTAANTARIDVADQRSINNADRLDGAEVAISETNTQVTADRNDSVQRDKALASESGRIEGESIARDDALRGQVDYQAAVNHAYQQQSAEKFDKMGAGIEANAAAIASERNARQEADRDLQAGVAGAVAAGSHMMDVSYQGLQMSVAGGAYRGASAASIAVGGAVSSSTFMHINVTHDSRGHQTVGGNVNFKF